MWVDCRLTFPNSSHHIRLSILPPKLFKSEILKIFRHNKLFMTLYKGMSRKGTYISSTFCFSTFFLVQKNLALPSNHPSLPCHVRHKTWHLFAHIHI